MAQDCPIVVFNQLEGLFWDEDCPIVVVDGQEEKGLVVVEKEEEEECEELRCGSVKRVTFESEEPTGRRRKPLWEFLAEDYAEDGLDLSGSDRFAFSVDDALQASNDDSVVSRMSLLLLKLKHGFSKHKEGGQGQGHSRRFFPWRYDWESKEEKTQVEENRGGAGEKPSSRSFRKRRVGPVDHELVLKALSRALEVAELAYLEMMDKVLDRKLDDLKAYIT